MQKKPLLNIYRGFYCFILKLLHRAYKSNCQLHDTLNVRKDQLNDTKYSSSSTVCFFQWPTRFLQEIHKKCIKTAVSPCFCLPESSVQRYGICSCYIVVSKSFTTSASVMSCQLHSDLMLFCSCTPSCFPLHPPLSMHSTIKDFWSEISAVTHGKLKFTLHKLGFYTLIKS